MSEEKKEKEEEEEEEEGETEEEKKEKEKEEEKAKAKVKKARCLGAAAVTPSKRFKKVIHLKDERPLKKSIKRLRKHAAAVAAKTHSVEAADKGGIGRSMEALKIKAPVGTRDDMQEVAEARKTATTTSAKDFADPSDSRHGEINWCSRSPSSKRRKIAASAALEVPAEKMEEPNSKHPVLSLCRSAGRRLLVMDKDVIRFWLGLEKRVKPSIVANTTVYLGIIVDRQEFGWISPGKYVSKVIARCTWDSRVAAGRGKLPTRSVDLFILEVAAHRRLSRGSIGIGLCCVFFDRDDGSFHMIMPMADDTLANYGKEMDGRVLEYALAGSIVCMWGLHSRGMCHCDIKPDNVAVARHASDLSKPGILDRVTFIDLGDVESVFCPRQRTVMSVGTKSYVSGEIKKNRGRALGFSELRQNDVWALGASAMAMYRIDTRSPKEGGPPWSLEGERKKISLRVIDEYLSAKNVMRPDIPGWVKKFLESIAFADDQDQRDISTAVRLIPEDIAGDLKAIGAFSWDDGKSDAERYIPLSACVKGIPVGLPQYYFSEISDKLNKHYYVKTEAADRSDPDFRANAVRFAIVRDLVHLSMFSIMCDRGLTIDKIGLVRLFVGSISVYSTVCSCSTYDDMDACSSLFDYLLKMFDIFDQRPSTRENVARCAFEFLEEVDYDIDRPTPTARLAWALWKGDITGENELMTEARFGVFSRCAAALRCAYIVYPWFVTQLEIEQQAASIFYVTITNAFEQYSQRFSEPIFNSSIDEQTLRIAKSLYDLSEDKKKN
jgi:serine/threonine protein kinase